MRRLGILFMLAAAMVIPGASLFADPPLRVSEVLKDVRFDQRLGNQVPLDAVFQNEAGQTVHLRDYFGQKPVVLNLVYYQCPMLCTEVLNGLIRAIRTLKFNVGDQYNIVTISFDPHEKPLLAAEKSKSYAMKYERPVRPGAWPFLTGDEASIRKVTDAVGFRYVYDEKWHQYAHAAGLVVLTPEGKVSRYLYGVEYSPKDLRLALIEASGDKIGTPVDQLLLFCYHYDPTTGRYGVPIIVTLRIMASVTALAMAVFIIVMLRREKYA